MKATVITIGDEILIGQTIDTNSAWIGKELNKLGVKLNEIVSCADNAQQIVSALNRSIETSDVVLLTGGLGPTKDDITKKTLCDYFNTELVFVDWIWTRMVEIFEKRGKQVLEMNRSQAMMPEACTVLPNERGTAQGMWFEKDGKVIVSMPGVPFEMKHLMEKQVLPRLQQTFSFPKIIHRTFMTAGAGESVIASKLSDFESKLPDTIKLAYLPELGVVKLRLSAFGATEKTETEINELASELEATLGELVFANYETTLQQSIGELLTKQNATVSCAESCTGGYISHLFTSVPGSSRYFEGSVISYSYAIKESLLNVDGTMLQQEGAVSEACVVQMLKGLLTKTGTSYGIAVSGIAGPDGGSPEKPVGTVWIAVGSQHKQIARKFTFFKSRAENILVFSNTALNMLRLFILQQNLS